MNTVVTRQVTIWMAGDLATAYRVCRAFCYRIGSCFTVTPSKFIYTGGEEDGFAIGLVNYPRFPSEASDLQAKAERLARRLLVACNQRTCLFVGTAETRWLVIEPPGVTSAAFDARRARLSINDGRKLRRRRSR